MVEVIKTQDKGRGLFTTTGFSRGSVVLSSLPLVYTLARSQKGVRCDYCLRRQEMLLRCSGCKFMKYCNRECQKGAWRVHKPECVALKRVSPKIPPDFVILLSRVLWKLEKAMDDQKPEELVSIVDLESNYNRLSDSQKECLGQFIIVLHSYWGQGTLPLQTPDIKAVLELCAKLKNNSFAISDEEMQVDIGTGIYLSCSLMNHCCQPNCVVEFKGLQLNVKAIRNLVKGEEVLISYTDLFAPSIDRKKELMEIYRFTCQCCACSNETNDKDMLQDFDGVMTRSKREAINDLLADLQELKSAGNHEEISRIAESYILRNVLPCENIYMAKVLDFAMDACIELQKLELALKYGLSSLNAYRKYLNEYHPMTGLQLLKLGKILLYLERNTQALPLLLEAQKILHVTHSDDGVVVNSLKQLLGQCQCELRHKEERT